MVQFETHAMSGTPSLTLPRGPGTIREYTLNEYTLSFNYYLMELSKILLSIKLSRCDNSKAYQDIVC